MRYKKALGLEFVEITKKFLIDTQLEAHYKNHPLTGEWHGYWECHIKPDLLFIY